MLHIKKNFTSLNEGFSETITEVIGDISMDTKSILTIKDAIGSLYQFVADKIKSSGETDNLSELYIPVFGYNNKLDYFRAEISKKITIFFKKNLTTNDYEFNIIINSNAVVAKHSELFKKADDLEWIIHLES